ncbi:MAG: hypothetical protein DYG93_11230 [Leptolyngbya sp. PLA2]|nr:hypothetical protein [Leptolyngbya sp.]MCE7972216.1 hypothetical protein [Leptolyngbya sp. PL-A2]MCQ3941205.1 hypothetical protein [cyanobacterium CYA1]MDL1905489.1 hypothetical protein [Synechococcales cyanobacterium CNB]
MSWWTDPRLIAPGVVPPHQAGAGGGAGAAGGAADALLGAADTSVKVGGFTAIAVSNPTIGASAWFKFQSLRVGIDGELAQPSAVSWIGVEMLPTDNAGSAGIAWGDARGHGAAIVIGRNLPGPFQEWYSYPSNVVGVETSGVSLLLGRSTLESLFVTTFPTGKYNDAAPNKGAPVRYFPHPARLRRGDSLDMCLVVRGSQINGQTGTLTGGVIVQVAVAPPYPDSVLR